MHPGGVRSAMDLFDFEKSANLKHPTPHIEAMGPSTVILLHLLQKACQSIVCARIRREADRGVRCGET